MPSTYEVHGGVAYPPRQRYTGPLCPDCQRRGRHMPWCSNASATTAPAAPALRIVRPEEPPRPVAPAKRRSTGLPPDEEAHIERELAFARSKGWELPKFEKLLRKNAKVRQAYIADRMHVRSLTPGAPDVDTTWYLEHTVWGQRQREGWAGYTRNDSPAGDAS